MTHSRHCFRDAREYYRSGFDFHSRASFCVFGDLCRGHPPRDAISIADRILITSRSRQTEPHVCVNIVLRHA